MHTTSDLLIIGGGILGASHAYHALRKGLRVTLCERHPAPQSATVRNFGQVVPSGMNPVWQAYGRKSLEVYQTLHQDFNLPIQQAGSIYIASNAAEIQLIEELHEINKSNDYPSILLNAQQCLEKYPPLQPEYAKAGLFFPQEISVNPTQLIHHLISILQSMEGFYYSPNTLIRELDSSGTRVVAKSNLGVVFTAEKAIVCAGAELEWLYPEILQSSDLQFVKLQMLRLKPQDGIRIPGNILTGLTIRRYESFQECPSFATVKATEDKDAFWKKWGIHILFKQEADGSIILGDSHEYADTVPSGAPDFFLREEISRYFIQEGAHILRLKHWEIDSQWTGVYTQCKNQDVFQHTVNQKVFILTGIGGKGMTASPGFAMENLEKIWNI